MDHSAQKQVSARWGVVSGILRCESPNTLLDISFTYVLPTHMHFAETPVLVIQTGSHSPMAVKNKNRDFHAMQDMLLLREPAEKADRGRVNHSCQPVKHAYRQRSTNSERTSTIEFSMGVNVSSATKSCFVLGCTQARFGMTTRSCLAVYHV